MNQMLKFTKDETYEGKVIVMGKHKTGKVLNKVSKFGIGVLGIAFTAIVTFVLGYFLVELNTSVKDLNKTLFDFRLENNGRLIRVELSINSMENRVSSLEEKYNKFVSSSQEFEKARLIAPAGPFINAIASSIISDIKVIEATNILLWNNGNEVIATSPDKSVEYTANDLKNEKVIFTYMEDGEQIIFCGQYSENSRWDGNCIINRYRDGKLTFIMDAEYNDGVLLNYKYVFTDKDKNDVDRWYVADWIVKGETISGSTTSYKKIEDCTLDVNENEITYEDVKTVSIFCEEISSPVMGYYNGQFSNCEFNDTTGDAYLIEYDDEGYIKYFYNGNIVNGKEDDHTGKAWSISWGHNNTDYYFYRGNFTNGERDGELDSEKDKISNEKIISVIKDNIGSENSFAWRKTDTK